MFGIAEAQSPAPKPALMNTITIEKTIVSAEIGCPDGYKLLYLTDGNDVAISSQSGTAASSVLWYSGWPDMKDVCVDSQFWKNLNKKPKTNSLDNLPGK